MLDTVPVTLQRSRGEAAVTLKSSVRGTEIERLRQAGSAKAFLPKIDAPDPEVVFLNTSGGLTGGDVLNYSLALGAGARATAATQTAERGYRSVGGAARVRVRLSAGDGAHLSWLPQETILFDGANLDRETTVELAANATYLGVETVVLGRSAMGETVRTVGLRDIRRVSRCGRPVVVDPLELDGSILGREDDHAGLGGETVLASLTYVAPNAEDRLAGLRALIGPGCAASAWDGRLVMRALSRDAANLRRMTARAVAFLTGRPVPRVWQV